MGPAYNKQYSRAVIPYEEYHLVSKTILIYTNEEYLNSFVNEKS